MGLGQGGDEEGRREREEEREAQCYPSDRVLLVATGSDCRLYPRLIINTVIFCA